MDISKEELYKAIGTKIRAMRTAKGWTQEELGNKFDVSPQYISRIERGSAHLSLQKLYVLAGILECSIYAILPYSLLFVKITIIIDGCCLRIFSNVDISVLSLNIISVNNRSIG